MKRNLILFGVLLSLLVVTYLFQEKRTDKKMANDLIENRLIQEINHIEWSGVDAFKKNNQWWMGKELLSSNHFRVLEKKLSEIKKMREVQGDFKIFFSDPLIFKVNGIKWSIGDFTLDRQGFYIAQGEQVMVAEIEGESYELTQNEEEIASIKLEELKSLFLKKPEELKETQLFRFYPNLSLDRVLVKAEGDLGFELNLKANTTLPPPIPGIQVHEKLREKFFSLLTQVNIRQEIPYASKLKYKKLGQIDFLEGKEPHTWELWLKSKSNADAVLIDNQSRRAFLMVGGTLKVFFVHLQDYWDKKVVPPFAFESFSRLKARLSQGSQVAEVTVLNREPLGFEPMGHQKIKQAQMERLFQLVFNMGPSDQASRVSLCSKTDRQQILNEDLLKLEVMGQELIIWKKNQEVIVVNLTQGFKAHFALVDENFRAGFRDMLE